MMASTRVFGVFTLFSLLFGSSLAAQQQFPAIVYEVKEAVVKIEIHLLNTQDRDGVSDQLRLCFRESDYCVIGTGVRLNDDGDVLTAAHVARDTTAASQSLRDLGIDSEVMIAGEARNAEYVKGEAGGTGGALRASIKKIDPEHDVALLEPESNGLKQGISAIDSGSRVRRRALQTVEISVQRPDVAEALFAFGFPMYSPTLITTPGSIVLAIGSKNLIEARKSGDTELVPVYRAKLESSPGNSGGPLFRTSDGALLGIESEIGDERDIVATVIPATEIAKFLSANAIRWNAAPPRRENAAKANHKKAKP
jgi:S1-C subfamily serine protease